MKSVPNHRRWIVPAAWLGTAAVAFSIGRMSSWLEEPIVPPAQTTSAAGGVGAGAGFGAGSGFDGRVGSAFTVGGEQQGALSVGQVTGGQPLEDWLKKLMAQDDDIYRMQNFVRLFDSLNSVEDITTALKVIAGSGRGRGMRFTEYSMLLQKLTQVDSKAALAFASAAEGGERFMATGTVLRTWAKTEPDAALAWAKENGVPPAGEGENDGRRGTENFALASVVTQLAKTNLDKALTEAGAADFGRGAGRTADALVAEAMEQRGAEQAKAMLGSLPEGDFRNQFAEQLAGRLAATDPQGTAQWAMAMESGDAKREVLNETLGVWLRADAPAAQKFVSSLPVAADYDSARQRAAQQIATTDQSSALKLVQGITEPERQARTVSDISRNIARQDVASAQNFVLQSPLADEMKAQLAQRLAQPQQRGGDRGEGFRGFRGGR